MVVCCLDVPVYDEILVCKVYVELERCRILYICTFDAVGAKRDVFLPDILQMDVLDFPSHVSHGKVKLSQIEFYRERDANLFRKFYRL